MQILISLFSLTIPISNKFGKSWLKFSFFKIRMCYLRLATRCEVNALADEQATLD